MIGFLGLTLSSVYEQFCSGCVALFIAAGWLELVVQNHVLA